MPADADSAAEKAFQALMAEEDQAALRSDKAKHKARKNAGAGAAMAAPDASDLAGPASSSTPAKVKVPSREPSLEATEGIWETFTRRARNSGASSSSSAKPQAVAVLDREHLGVYLRSRFDGRGPGSFEHMWRRHAPLDQAQSGNWGYSGPKHKHSYEENPAAREAIDGLLVSGLAKVDPKVERLVQERFTLTKATVHDLTAWILERFAQGLPMPSFRIEADLAGRIKISAPDLAGVRDLLPGGVRAELDRTGNRTGLTLNLNKQLVWEHGLRIVLDVTGLKTVHSSGRQSA